MIKKLALLLFTCLIISLCFSGARALAGEIDKVAVVTRVIDGDTFDIDSGDRIRLADVNTPENGEVGYQEAKEYVAGLVEGKNVYIDVDDNYTWDTSGTRLVAVIYVSYNSTHFLNLNKALLQNHYATVWDHDNDFNPNNWSLYASKTAIPEFPIIISLVVVLAVVSLFLIVDKRNLT